MTKQEVITLFDFNRWARDRMLTAVTKLTQEQFVLNQGNSFPSIRDTLVHIMNAERNWLERWTNSVPQQTMKTRDFPTVAILLHYWDNLESQIHTFVTQLDVLDRQVNLTQPMGLTLPLWQTIQHVVNHGTYHRGQVTTMLRQLGADAPITDLASYYAEIQQKLCP